jgi:hypothetical protein
MIRRGGARVGEAFEPVYEVVDYLDRPLKGVADFGGIPHRFCLVGWASPPLAATGTWETLEPWLLEHWNPDEDRYALAPTTAPGEPATWARAAFLGVEPGFEVPAGGASALRVRWRPVPIQERLGHILEAQRWATLVGVPDTPAYICVGIYLVPADLEEVRPDLRQRNPELPATGDEGRYQMVPVFPAAARSRAEAPCGYFQGVWFAYVPALAVD